MARKFLIPLQAEIDALIVTNNTGAITANILRPLLTDILESTSGVEGWVSHRLPTVNFLIDTTWTEVPMDAVEGGDNSYLTPELVSSSILTSATGGWIYNMAGDLCIDGPVNRVIELAVAVDGVPMGNIGALTLEGIGRPSVALAGFYQEASTPSESYTLVARCTSHPSVNTTIRSAALKASLNPTPGP